MTKTYEANWHNPETGIDILVARGSKDYVKSCAQMSQFVPYTIREFQTPENIRADYRDWRKDNNNRKPNRVIVKMRWEDGDNTEKGYQIDTIGIIPQSKIGNTENIPGDALILYYVSSLEELIGLMKPGNGSDFIVDEVLEFYKA
jgi:hypothetical protein